MKKLTLSKETLRTLNDDALTGVAGGFTGFCQGTGICNQTGNCQSGQVCTVGCFNSVGCTGQITAQCFG